MSAPTLRAARPVPPGAPSRIPDALGALVRCGNAYRGDMSRGRMPSRRRFLPTVALLAAGALLAGCGAPASTPGGTSGGGSVPGAPPSGGVPAPLPEPPGASGIPEPTVTDPEEGRRERRIPWRLVSAAGTPAPSLVVETAAGGAPCDTVTGLDVAETATSITVTLWAGRTAAAGSCDGPQVAMARLYRIRVPLSAPAGTRAILPGPVG